MYNFCPLQLNFTIAFTDHKLNLQQSHINILKIILQEDVFTMFSDIPPKHLNKGRHMAES